MKKELRSKKIKFIPVNVPKIFFEDKINVKDCLNSGWISSEGSYVKDFEKKFSKYNKRKYGVAVSSGTAALEVALKALNLKPKDEVIIPAFTWVSVANVVLHTGADLVLADVEENTNNISISEIKKKITKKTKAIIVAHLFGLIFDIKSLRKKIAKNIIIIEDCACAVGAKINNNFAGSMGDIGVFSFHPRKIITTGEGGIVVTNNTKLATTINSLRNHGAKLSEELRHNSKKPFLMSDYDVPGLNYRMTDLQGSIGIIQLKKLDKLLIERRKYAKFYYKKLKKLKWIRLSKINKNISHSWQAFVFHFNPVNLKIKREDLMELLESKNIASRSGTHAIHMLSYYKKRFNFKPSDFPNAKKCHENTIALPLHNNIKLEDYKYIVEKLYEIDLQISKKY